MLRRELRLLVALLSEGCQVGRVPRCPEYGGAAVPQPRREPRCGAARTTARAHCELATCAGQTYQSQRTTSRTRVSLEARKPAHRCHWQCLDRDRAYWSSLGKDESAWVRYDCEIHVYCSAVSLRKRHMSWYGIRVTELLESAREGRYKQNSFTST